MPPLDGMRLQLRTLVHELARDHDVCVLALRWPDQVGGLAGAELIDVPPPANGVVDRIGDRALALLRSRPVDWTRRAGRIAETLPDLLAGRSFDVAHVMLDDLAGIAPLLGDLPAIVAPLDARPLNIRAQRDTGARWARPWRAHQEWAVRRRLATALRPFGAAVFVSEDDADAVRRLDPTVRARVIPLAVDVTSFARPPSAPERDRSHVLFTGVLSTPANERAARRLADCVMPLVRTSVPEARLSLVGRSPSPALRAFGADPNVEVVGDADDLRPWLWRTTVFACPMVDGTGTKNKLLEAMAAGAPVVASPLACRGLRVRDGEQVLLGRTDEELAAQLVRLLRDAPLRQRLAGAARRYVCDLHAPEAIAARYVGLYAEVIAGARSPGVG